MDILKERETPWQQIRIGNVTLHNPWILAPMAGVTDLPFRLLCAMHGAGLVCMEMISAKALAFHNKNTLALLKTDPQERPVSLQLFGNDPDIMAGQARCIEHLPFDLLDLNMGCPVPKVAGNGEGSALMKDPLLAGRIIERIADSISKPVTVKIRKGFDEKHVNAVEIARIAQESGAAAVAVHARTREQYYSGKADWNVIREVKNAVSIPVIGNGDADSPESALEMMELTGCDAVMIGRAARGNPWIFERIQKYADTGIDPGRPDLAVIGEMILRHARMEIRFKEETGRENPEETAVREMRKHIAWYTAGLPHSAAVRAAANEISTYAQLEQLIGKMCENAKMSGRFIND